MYRAEHECGSTEEAVQVELPRASGPPDARRGHEQTGENRGPEEAPGDKSGGTCRVPGGLRVHVNTTLPSVKSDQRALVWVNPPSVTTMPAVRW